MAKASEPGISIKDGLQRLLHLSGRNQIWLYAALAAAFGEVIITIGWNIGLMRLINAVSDHQMDVFLRNLMLTLAVFALGPFVNYVRTYSLGRFSENTVATLRERFATQATVLPMQTLETRHTGDLLTVVNSDLVKLKTLTGSSLLDVFYQSLMGVGALITLFALCWPLALVITIMLPVMIMAVGKLNAPIGKRSEEMQATVGNTMSMAQDGLAGLMVTKAFNLVDVMDERFRVANHATMQKGLLLARLRATIDAGGTMFGLLPFLITFGLGGYLALNGLLTFGSLMSFINLLNFVANPLSQLPPAIARVSEGVGAIQRLYAILDVTPERSSGESYLPADETVAVRYEGVDFGYDVGSSGHLALRHIDATITRGQMVAIVGSSGGGKSTLLKVLLGFYPINAGSILLFGRDLNMWSLVAARRQMAFVAQDTYLFPVNIGENIACGKPGATQAEIERAARMANIHDDIMAMVDGYKTLVGERGARLSGGQRQRISLARAILKDAPVLLLDEPTSALDTASESLVQDALEKFMTGRTTIVVAHRLSTIRRADRVLVIEEGQIVEAGTHDELLNHEGRYRELYMRQFQDAVQTPVVEAQQ